ncbi:hypothetical protein QYF61_000869 [Mycteria americana]|uniref:RNase H type-1 domain-containing protein n=1 Tax=Mycteria americana TaxID=33587 RepID=A0AAN7S525_MYCAM|nr:hypothetical protein QYF61_000869 [Mycteria americana]
MPEEEEEEQEEEEGEEEEELHGGTDIPCCLWKAQPILEKKVKAIQLALDIAELEKRPVLYIYTDSWMVTNALRGWIEKWKQSNWQHRGKPIWAAALWQDIAAQVENLVVKVHHVDVHIPEGYVTEEHRKNKQVEKAARNGIWTMPLTTCFNFWSDPNSSGSWTR